MTTTLLLPHSVNDTASQAFPTVRDGQPHQHDTAGRTDDEANTTLLSFVIPVKEEEQTLDELRKRIAANVPNACEYEIIFIDDGSRDGSWRVIADLSTRHPAHVRGIRFRHNVGKAAALTAGFRAAHGEFIFTLDADLQDDPQEIHRFLDKLSEGYGLVSGWKKTRHDPWHKVLPSRVFNWMVSRTTGVALHDHNCGFKCYRAELAKCLTLHGEMHRMVPSLSAMLGFDVAEIQVEHHARRFGRSKYGIERFVRGFSDMLTVGFLQRFRERPAHFVNAVAAIYCAIAAACAVGGLTNGLGTLAGMLTFLAGVVFFGMAGTVVVAGLLSELHLRGGLPADWQLPIVNDTSCRVDGVSGSVRQVCVDTRYVA